VKHIGYSTLPAWPLAPLQPSMCVHNKRSAGVLIVFGICNARPVYVAAAPRWRRVVNAV